MSLRHAPAIPGVELYEVIGSGGAGVVYRGRQLAFDRPVAVKVSAADGTDGATRRRWEREVAAVGRLSNHPNVVPVFDAGITPEGAAYLVMALVPGGTLGDRLRDEGPLPADEVAAIGSKLAATLHAVHAAGVLHRDIKPDNVLWSPHGEPQLTDFGIARLADRTATLTHSVQATVSYAAPEVLAGQEATEATDVYGLGATLYACLSGRAPHASAPDEHPAAAMARALEEDPPALADDGVPVALAAVIHRAIARDPADRQPDAARLRHDLDRAAEHLDRGSPGPDATAVMTAAAPVGTRLTTREPTQVEAAVPPRTPPADPDGDGHSGGGAGRGAVDSAGHTAGRGGNRALWLGVLAVVVLAVGLLVMQAMTDDGGGGDTATGTTAPEASAPPETEPPATTDEPSTTTTAEPTTTEPEPTTTTEATTTTEDDAGGADGPADLAVTYFQLLDDDRLDEAWQLTTSRFQAQQDRGDWEAFWGGADVDVVGEPRVDEGAGVVVVPLSYDGQREDYRLDVVRRGGGWLVDGPVGG
ncbi:MAG: protein kinase domain-containing protein [Acidimicrobiia bacterium]